MNWWQVLLFPFTIVYNVITRFRNHLFNIGYSRSFQFDANVINVGNLAVGGTGKSPMVIYLLDHFIRKGLKTASLSRGYGRKTKGFRVLTDNDTAVSAGDEPLLFFRRFKGRSIISVGEDRALAIPQLLYEDEDLDVIVLDDAFQHRTVTPSFNILLTTFQRPFYKDYVLPSGLLREARKGAKRADSVLVTKCPENLSIHQMVKMSARVKKYAPEAEVFFTSLKYGGLRPLSDLVDKKNNTVIVCGIANPELFISYTKKNFSIVDSRIYGDHHSYSAKEVMEIMSLLKKYDAKLVTTEKDAVKLGEFDELKSFACYILPVDVYFLKDEERFIELLDQSIKSYQRK